MALEDLVFGVILATLCAIIAILIIWRQGIEHPEPYVISQEFKEYLRRKEQEEHPGPYVSSQEFKKYRDLGFRFIACGADATFVASGARSMAGTLNNMRASSK